MKKLMLILTLILCLVLAACGNANENTDNSAEENTAAEPDPGQPGGPPAVCGTD